MTDRVIVAKRLYWFFTVLVLLLGLRWVFLGVERGVPFMVYHLDERAVALYAHMAASMVPMALIPFQISTRFRLARPRAHRLMGWLAITGALVGGIAMMPLALNMPIPAWGRTGFVLAGLIWVTTAAVGLYYIRIRNFKKHQFWMTLCAVTIFGAVTQRLAYTFIVGSGVPAKISLSLSSWLGFGLNLTVYFLWRHRSRINEIRHQFVARKL